MSGRFVGLALLLATLASGAALAQSDDDTPPDIIATQIRSQGYECGEAENAVRDQSDSTPGEQAWILTCSNATYRVKFVPDQAAFVEKLD